MARWPMFHAMPATKVAAIRTSDWTVEKVIDAGAGADGLQRGQMKQHPQIEFGVLLCDLCGISQRSLPG